MKAENPDTVGWLTVPGTDIDNVIVQSPKDNNGFYTNHDFAGNESKDGTYFADNRADFTTPTREGISQNVTLNGHSWDENPDGRLFVQLKRFKDEDFAEAHPYIFFSTEAEDLAYEIFAVYHATVNQPYIIPDLPWASLREVLELAYAASLYDYGVRLSETDKILTLSTCSFEPPGRSPLPFDQFPDYRFVIMARLVSPSDEQKQTAAITVNPNPLIPDAMPTIYSQYADAIQYGGILYDNLARSHADKIPEIDPANLTPVGEITRSMVMRDLQDFDATKLPQGTPLYRLDGYENMLVAMADGETLVYGYGMK
jgi:sortase B